MSAFRPVNKLVLVASFLWALTSHSFAGSNIFEISSELNGKPLGMYLGIFVDEHGAFSINEVRALPLNKFKFSPDEDHNFGFTNDVIWARMEILNSFNESKRVFIENNYANTDLISVYYQDRLGNHRSKQIGDRVPLSQWDVEYRLPTFDLQVAPGRSVL